MPQYELKENWNWKVFSRNSPLLNCFIFHDSLRDFSYICTHCFADSNSFVDDTDADFRSRVEQIRQIGGDSWLKIFDEIQGEEEMTQVLWKIFIK